MAIQAQWRERGIYWECTGVVGRQEVMNNIIDHFYNDERSMNIDYQIFDCSQAEALLLTEQDVVFFAGTDVGRSRTLLDLRIALVATETSIVYLMQLYKERFSRVNRRWKISIFEDPVEASGWAMESNCIQY